MRNYLFCILLAFDVLINAILMGRKYQTLSGRAYATTNFYWRWTATFINKLANDPDHCKNAHAVEVRMGVY